MSAFQVWLVQALATANPVRAFMHSRYGWPAMESVHFVGLSLLVGSVALWDLRLLGVGRRIPLAAMHRLIPFALLGFAINVGSGLTFLMTEPNQYVYNPAFHFKVLFLIVAGLNAVAFYPVPDRRRMRTGAGGDASRGGKIIATGAGGDASRGGKIIAAISLSCWIAVIVCGRLLTFYRPTWCGPEGPGTIAYCVPAPADK
jgi:hypothetical protein